MGGETTPHLGARARLLHDLPVSERVIDVAGIATPILEAGDGPPVVLLHGIGSFSLEWALLMPLLADRNRVIAPDLPGLGASKTNGRQDIDERFLVDWLHELVRQTGPERPTLIGHSAGGGLAARLAVHHDSAVRQVVLVDSSSLGRFRPSLGLVQALLRFGVRPSPKGRDRFLRHLLSQPERARSRWAGRWAALEAYDLEQAGDKDVSASNGRLFRTIGVRRIKRERLAAIEVPVSLVWGRQDRLMRYAIAERSAARFGWPLSGIDDCGHGPQIEAPDELAEILASILAT